VLGGFDVDVSSLIFNRILGLPVQFVSYAHWTAAKAAALVGQCDVFLSANSYHPEQQACPDASQSLLSQAGTIMDYTSGDYASGEGAFAYGAVECVQFSAPYIYGGLALLSVLAPPPFNIINAVFNADVCNAVSVLVLCVLSAGFLIGLVERRNEVLGSPARGLLWSFRTFLAVSEEFPRNKPGKMFMILAMLCNILAMSIVTLIIGARLTTTALSTNLVRSLGDVKGKLCHEQGYQLVLNYISSTPTRPSAIMSAPDVSACIDSLLSGESAAVLADSTILSWFANYYGYSTMYMSPILTPNPFVMVFGNGSNGLLQ